jgi:hypothetical protein
MIFAAKIGIEKGKDGYPDKNKIAVVVTPDKKEYQAVMTGQPVGAAPAFGAQATSTSPPWAAGAAPAPQAQPKSTTPSWAV